jgi:hypothetical protein
MAVSGVPITSPLDALAPYAHRAVDGAIEIGRSAKREKALFRRWFLWSLGVEAVALALVLYLASPSAALWGSSIPLY